VYVLFISAGFDLDIVLGYVLPWSAKAVTIANGVYTISGWLFLY
jgi:hypothetical protein